MASEDERDRPPRSERPDYKVYRSRPSLRDRLRRKDRDPLAGKVPDDKRPDRGERTRLPARRPPWRRVLKWTGIAVVAWLVLSVAAFAVSAQIQKSKLDDGVDAGAAPLMPLVSQTILVLGTDIRSGQFAGQAEAETKRCLEEVGGGRGSHRSCRHAPYRSDTIMLIRAGGGAFRQLSLPRDTLADVPGVGVTKVNAAYANGGAELAKETVENYFGLDIDQVAIVDFDGFRRFIDALGGVKVNLNKRVCSTVSGGTFKLDLKRGEHTLNGYQAITLARTRTSGDCNGDGTPDSNINDLDRARFQQAIVQGIQGRLTSITRLPINFIKGPILGWNAPQAMVSSMGAITMPELVVSAAIGGSETITMGEPTSLDPLVFSDEECRRAARRFLGKQPPRTPACSP